MGEAGLHNCIDECAAEELLDTNTTALDTLTSFLQCFELQACKPALACRYAPKTLAQMFHLAAGTVLFEEGDRVDFNYVILQVGVGGVLLQ